MYLLDTNILLMYFSGDTRLNSDTIKLLDFNSKSNKTTSYNFKISLASLWEMRIKQRLKKLSLPATIEEDISNFFGKECWLAVTKEQINIVPTLSKDSPNDPFDQILISQAIDQMLVLITKDEKILNTKQSGLRVLEG